MTKRILLADNNQDSLEVYTGILTRHGYYVVPAATYDEAKRILEAGKVDLAILDLRLRDDEDDKDVSGVLLAREVAPAILKIILTEFPEVFSVCIGMRQSPTGAPAIFDFLEKGTDTEPLLQAIERSWEAVQINCNATREIFIVHGHDEAARATVSDFLRQLDLRPIILCEQAGEGRVVLQQIEHYSEVGFVIVLITPDDVGYPKIQPKAKKFRARQNVILELGFFIGKLGSDKVRCLYKEGVEMPSDYQGIIYIPLDPSHGWKLNLAREMVAAGVPVDLSKLVPGRHL